ncbi:hypothetical protein SVIOM74S_10413 [Streptomyces violarus]
MREIPVVRRTKVPACCRADLGGEWRPLPLDHISSIAVFNEIGFA